MNRTRIEWTTYTWNPVTGCRNGCPWCYAARIARRFPQRYPRGFAPTFWPERLEEPRRVRRPARIFVCSMGELFADWVPSDWQRAVLDVARACPWHRFIFLTKSPRNLIRQNPWPDNAWVGASATDQRMASEAVSALRDVQAPVRFVSFEPLLGPIDADLSGLDWVIIGALTGPAARQPEVTWVETLIARARAAGAAIFVKDNLRWPERIQEWPQ